MAEQYPSLAECKYKVDLLRSIFLECPNLQELDLFCPDDDFQTSTVRLWQPNLTFKLKKLTLRAESRILSSILVELINACPDLRSFSIASNVEGYPNGGQLILLGASRKVNLEKLDELNFGSTAPLSSHAVILLRLQKLTLSKLEITLARDVASMKEMFQHLSGTLTSFVCEICRQTTRFALVFPSNMTRLTTVVITTDDNTHLMDTIISASRLPNLNTLLLFGVLKYSSLSSQYCFQRAIKGPDFAACWTLRQSELNVKNCCPSLKTLQIPGGLTSEQVFGHMAAVFPNVTDLRLQNPSADVIPAVFANYRHLERLSVKMDRFPSEYNPYPQYFVRLRPTWSPVVEAERQNFLFFNPAQDTQIWAGLKDMKNLKYFELQQQEVSCEAFYRTTTEPTSPNRVTRLITVADSHRSEGSLLHGLQYLTRAVRIDVQGWNCQPFYKEAIEELKFALGPYCVVNIT